MINPALRTDEHAKRVAWVAGGVAAGLRTATADAQHPGIEGPVAAVIAANRGRP